MEQQLPQPSQSMQEFLSSGFFSPSVSPSVISNSSGVNTQLQQPEMMPLNTGTKTGAETLYGDMIGGKNIAETLIVGKPAKPIEIDSSYLFKPAAPSKTAQEAIQGIHDIKRRGDQIDMIDRSASVGGGDVISGGSNTNNITNNSNITNVTQVTPDYLMRLKTDYMRLPAWREVMG